MPSFRLPKIVLFVGATLVIAAKINGTGASSGGHTPACHPCVDSDKCHINDGKSNNLTRINHFPWGNEYVTGKHSFLTVTFLASDSRIAGPLSSVTIDNTLDSDAILAIHYADNLAIKDGQPTPMTKTILYKAFGGQQCKGALPEDSTASDVFRVNYDYQGKQRK